MYGEQSLVTRHEWMKTERDTIFIDLLKVNYISTTVGVTRSLDS